MNKVIDQARESPKARVYLLVGFLCVLAFLLIYRPSYEQKSVQLKTEGPGESKMADEFPREQVAGGLGRELDRDDEVQSIVDKLKPELEARSSVKFETIEVLKYKRQTVAGVNFFVKAKAKTTSGEEKIVHLRIYKHFTGSLELTTYQLDKSVEDEIRYFQ